MHTHHIQKESLNWQHIIRALNMFKRFIMMLTLTLSIRALPYHMKVVSHHVSRSTNSMVDAWCSHRCKRYPHTKWIRRDCKAMLFPIGLWWSTHLITILPPWTPWKSRNKGRKITQRTKETKVSVFIFKEEFDYSPSLPDNLFEAYKA